MVRWTQVNLSSYPAAFKIPLLWFWCMLRTRYEVSLRGWTCQNMEGLDICMRLVCAKYPRGDNNRFVVGDAARTRNTCPGHGGAHDVRTAIDLNYCTTTGFNMTHYRYTRSMPIEYANGFIHNGLVDLWKDEFPYRVLKIDVFDSVKNYALFELLQRVLPNMVIRISTGLHNHFQQVYKDSVGIPDDVAAYNHWRHVHLSLSGKPNWDAEMVTI